MPPKPTCRVVKRAGQTGARIDAKGCTVRTEKSATGKLTTKNKAGGTKIKVKEANNKFMMTIAGSTQQSVPRGWSKRTAANKAAYKNNHKILYDTGAQVTLMSKALLGKIGVNWRRTTNYHMADIQGVTGSENMKVLHDVPFLCAATFQNLPVDTCHRGCVHEGRGHRDFQPDWSGCYPPAQEVEGEVCMSKKENEIQSNQPYF